LNEQPSNRGEEKRKGALSGSHRSTPGYKNSTEIERVMGAVKMNSLDGATGKARHALPRAIVRNYRKIGKVELNNTRKRYIAPRLWGGKKGQEV